MAKSHHQKKKWKEAVAEQSFVVCSPRTLCIRATAAARTTNDDEKIKYIYKKKLKIIFKRFCQQKLFRSWQKYNRLLEGLWMGALDMYVGAGQPEHLEIRHLIWTLCCVLWVLRPKLEHFSPKGIKWKSWLCRITTLGRVMLRLHLFFFSHVRLRSSDQLFSGRRYRMYMICA